MPLAIFKSCFTAPNKPAESAKPKVQNSGFHVSVSGTQRAPETQPPSQGRDESTNVSVAAAGLGPDGTAGTAGEATQAWTADVHGPQPAQQGAASSAPHRCTAGTSLHSQGCHEDDAPSSSLHRQPPAVNAAHGADASHGAVPVVQQQPRQQPQKEGPLQVSLETAKGGAGGKPAHHQAAAGATADGVCLTLEDAWRLATIEEKGSTSISTHATQESAGAGTASCSVAPEAASTQLLQSVPPVPAGAADGIDRLFKYAAQNREGRQNHQQAHSSPALDASMSALRVRLEKRMANSHAFLSSDTDTFSTGRVVPNSLPVDLTKAGDQLLRRRPVSQIKANMVVALPPDLCLHSRTDWAAASGLAPSSQTPDSSSASQQADAASAGEGGGKAAKALAAEGSGTEQVAA